MDIFLTYSEPEKPTELALIREVHEFLIGDGQDHNRFCFLLRSKEQLDWFRDTGSVISGWKEASVAVRADLQLMNSSFFEMMDAMHVRQLCCLVPAQPSEMLKHTLDQFFNTDLMDLDRAGLTFELETDQTYDHIATYNLLRNYHGVSPQNIVTVNIPLPWKGEVKPAVALPNGSDQQKLDCQLALKSLTLTGDGQLALCPRYAETTEHIDVKTLGVHDAIRHKTYHCKTLSHHSLCNQCNAPCRFMYEGSPGKRQQKLMDEGESWTGHVLWSPFQPEDIPYQFDLSLKEAKEQEQVLDSFEKLLDEWTQKIEQVDNDKKAPLVSIECPVFKSGWLIPAILSVIYQSSLNWIFYTVWDGGDELSRRILEIVEAMRHPKLKVFFSENRGIARSRHFLSEQANEAYILPLDDDDLFDAMAVERYIKAAEQKPWFGIIRGRRRFIDEAGRLVDMEAWFPFEKRHYQYGMVQDLNNHCQPYLINRAAYKKTSGWEGFPHFHHAGEDCDIYLKAEEQGAVELIDDLLYYYRLNPKRTSHILKPEGAYEMWRLLADRSIERIGLPLERTNDRPPFEYKRKAEIKSPGLDDIDFVVPYYETHERELTYDNARPSEGFKSQFYELKTGRAFSQPLPSSLYPVDRVEMVFSSRKPATGTILVTLLANGSEMSRGETFIDQFDHYTKNVSIRLEGEATEIQGELSFRVSFKPHRSSYNTVRVLLTATEKPALVMRVFRSEKDHGRKLLDTCLQSLKMSGVKDDAIHVISKRQSSARNRNDGFASTSRPFVCFLDDDVELTYPTAMTELLAAMMDSEADLIGPKLLTNHGTIFCADPYFNDLGRPVPKGLGKPGEGVYDYRSEVPWLPTTLLLIKREVFLAIGGFDEGYIGSQMEDVDFCLKARRRGFKCIYAGDVSAIHHNHQRNDNFSENFRQFNDRWKDYPDLWISHKIEKAYL